MDLEAEENAVKTFKPGRSRRTPKKGRGKSRASIVFPIYKKSKRFGGVSKKRK